jgi:C-terminal processing protease CtpA/Prc
MTQLREEALRIQRQLQQSQVRQDELDRYRKQAEEVPRLRGYYQEWQRLKEEHAALEAEVELLRAGRTASPAQSPSAPPRAPGSWIGISLAQDPSGNGVSVLSLAPGGPAANAGVQVGDVILAVDNRPISTLQQVKEIIRAKPPGDRVLLDLARQGVRTLVYVPASPMPTFD